MRAMFIPSLFTTKLSIRASAEPLIRTFGVIKLIVACKAPFGVGVIVSDFTESGAVAYAVLVTVILSIAI